MSVFCDKRANSLSEPTLRRGHFTNQFNLVSGYEIGSLLWLYTTQDKNTKLSLIESSVNDGLKWMIDDNIISKAKVQATKSSSNVNLEIELLGKFSSKYYNLFLNLNGN